MFAAVVVLPTPPLDEHTASRMAGSVGAADRGAATPCRGVDGSASQSSRRAHRHHAIRRASRRNGAGSLAPRHLYRARRPEERGPAADPLTVITRGGSDG